MLKADHGIKKKKNVHLGYIVQCKKTLVILTQLESNFLIKEGETIVLEEKETSR